MNKTIDKDKAKKLINNSKGRIFSATFTKKDFTKRLINARIKVNYQAKTKRKAPYDPNKYNLICVYDMKNKGHKMINLQTLDTLNINKKKYIIL